jgi:CubicO group peptidase (beta-lactamase class C family)
VSRHNRLNRAIRLLAITAMLTGLSLAALADPVEDAVRAAMEQQKIPGLALLVAKNGKTVRAQGYGLANVELQVAVRPETLFQSGSMGKQFTAAGVMMLVEEGKVGLDDSVKKYFPDAPASWDAITVRNLLSHTSGIKNYTEGQIDYRKDYSEADLLKMAEGMALDFAPGENWHYSNTGYALLGILIHRVTGEFYGDFLQQRIFRPLGMSSTRVMSEADIIPNRSSGYRLVKGELKNQEYVSPTLNTTADGSLYFNVLDLAKWDAALYTEKLLKRASWQQVWTPMKLKNGHATDYGFGWFIHEANGHRLYEHAGAWQGYSTGIARYVDDQLTVAVLTNLDEDHARPMDIAHAVAALYNAALAVPAKKP